MTWNCNKQDAICSSDYQDFQFILVLVDYNPNSSLLVMDKIRQLQFAGEGKVFHAGFGMWQEMQSSQSRAGAWRPKVGLLIRPL